MTKDKKVPKRQPKRKNASSRFPDRILSIAAIVISIASFLYSTVWDIKDRKESLSIVHNRAYFIHPIRYEQASLATILLTNEYAYITEGFDFTISNTSERRISIVNIDIYVEHNEAFAYPPPLLKPPMKNADRSCFFEGPLSVKGEKKNLPIILDSNESLALTFHIKVGLTNKVDEILKTHYEYGSSINYNDLKRTLFEAGLDIWGNSVRRLSRNLYIPGEDVHFPVFKIIMISAKESAFIQSFFELSATDHADMFELYGLLE